MGTLNTQVAGAAAGVRRFYSVAEAARLLGLSQPTVYREIRAGRFPAIQIRGRYVVPAKAIDAMEQAAMTGLTDTTDAAGSAA